MTYMCVTVLYNGDCWLQFDVLLTVHLTCIIDLFQIINLMHTFFIF